MALRFVAIGVLSLLSVACGGGPLPPANMPPPLPASASLPTGPDPYSGIIEAGPIFSMANAPVQPGEVLLSIPFTYRTTAVLTEDVRGFSLTVGGTLVPAGAPGYFAGSFSSSRGGMPTGDGQEMWCFFRPPQDNGEERDPLCLLRDASALAAIAPTRLSPYLWTSFSPMTGTFDYAHTPIFELRSVDVPVRLTLEYRFVRWDDGFAIIGIHIRDKQVRTLRSRIRADGQQVIDTLRGEVVVQAVAGQPDRIEARLGSGA